MDGGKRLRWLLAFAPLAVAPALAQERPPGERLVDRELDRLRCDRRNPDPCVERLRTNLRAELDRPELARVGGRRCAPSRPADCGPVFDDCTPVAGLLIRALSELDEAGASATPEVLAASRRSSELEPFSFYALENFRSSEILPLVVERLNSADMDCRWSAYFAIRLLELRPSAAAPRLNVLVESTDWEERTKAAAALAGIGDPSSVAPLTRILRQPPASAQKEAALGLGTIGPPASSALPSLESVARTHWAWSVRSAAAGAARKISGRVIKPRPPSCKTSAIQVESRWIVRTDGKKQTLDPVEGDSVPGGGAGACSIASQGWDLFPLLEDGEVCIAGENRGEFGGNILLLARGRREVLRGGWDVNPLRSVRLGSDVFIIEGLEHVVWGGSGTLTRLSRDSRVGWRAEPFLELPGLPVAFAVRGARLLVLAKDHLDGEDQPCPPSQGKKVVPIYLLRISSDGSVESLP